MVGIKRLRTRLILLLVGLLVVVLGAVFVAVYTATDSSAERQASRQLEVGAKVFRRLLELRGQELGGATQVLVADFGFREAVASGDLATIRSALLNQSGRIGADEALFFDAQGNVRVSSRSDEGTSSLELNTLQPLGEGVLLVVIDNQPYLLVEALVMAPVAIGQVAMAFRLNAELATEMQRLTGLEVSFVTLSEGRVVDQVSTHGDYQAVGDELQRLASQSIVSLENQSYLSTRMLLLEQEDYQVKAELMSPLSESLAVFDLLKRELVIITLIALLLSSLVAYVLAGSLSRPVIRLASAARGIGEGDYATPVTLSREDELGLLAQSIDVMRLSIAERETQIAHNAYHDPLTGLGNLAKTRDRLADALGAERTGALVVLVLPQSGDLLKARGQKFHDQLVNQYARRLESVVPSNALLAYHPGQGFLVALEGLELDQAAIVTDGVLDQLGQAIRVMDMKLQLEWLAGIVRWPQHSRDPDELMRQVGIALADASPGPERIAVYQAKRDQDYIRRMRLIRDIRYAPQMKELSVVYQPKLDIASGEVRQVEALMRWNHSELGFIGPDEFILLAEQTGSIQKLSMWILVAICSQLRLWLDQGLHMQVAMNISALDLDDLRFPERVAMILQAQEIDPAHIAFEVTESALMKDPERSLRSLMRLRELGIDLAVDDYGTGYSSLATLKSLPVQDLKIDKSFVMQLAEGSEDAVIVKSTIELAHNMGLKVIAEGVENAECLAWLRQRGCDTAQGYFISRPIAAADLQLWLQSYKKNLQLTES
ncbi:MAG: putative bifunctional diguanylate cyclase/phosphodiesterase [Pseudomonas sp.]